MADEPLRPAEATEIEEALAYALRHDGKKPFWHSGEAMAKITAAHLVRYLELAGFVVMKKPPARGALSGPNAPLKLTDAPSALALLEMASPSP